MSKPATKVRQMMSALDDSLFAMLRRRVDANDIADILADLRAIKSEYDAEFFNRNERDQPTGTTTPNDGRADRRAEDGYCG